MFGQTKTKSSLSLGADRLSESLAALSRGIQINEALIKCLRGVVEDTDSTGGYYLLIDESDADNLVTQACFAPEGAIHFPTRLSVSASFSGRAITTGASVAINSITEPGLLNKEFGDGIKSALVVPLYGHGLPTSSASGHALVGVLCLVQFRKSGHYSPQIAVHVEAYASAMALAVCNDRLEQYRRKTTVESLQRISSYLEQKDPRTAGHSERVGRLCLMLGQKLGVDIETLMDLQAAATLMDIGTVAIPDTVLKKPSALTEEEFAIVANHPVVSYDICSTLALPERILMLVRNHHERLDGSGYPDKLRNSEVSLPLRILSLADAFDAMQCARYHREGMSQEEALRQITSEAGVKFDPLVAQALKELVESSKSNPKLMQEAA